MSAPPIAPLLSFTEPREPALLVPTDEEEEDEEEEQEMSLSKELITDLATVHVAKPRDFDGEHGYVDFKRELHLYVYASELEFRMSKAKIMFALLYMKSSAAASWAESYTSSAINEHDAGLATEAHDEWLMSCLKRALNPKVVEGIMRLSNKPTTYEELKKAAVVRTGVFGRGG
ncbi:hypothetical protein A7U60_g3739 [Sanghuangporus baumii]|uniref:Retrotransposon gag domain-containing protein n=1 Tax=Sanghuangporus baumii TaxID=108892 RepID=A0A9Q5HZY2_SANBA|nr:hypothetical protein A7U60_g3739 [Sanghuangporus baumii]